MLNLFATAAFLVYGWTLFASFWKIPSWIYFLRLNEIFSSLCLFVPGKFHGKHFAYTWAGLPRIFLSGNLWRDGFLAASVMMLILLVGSALVHMRIYDDPNLRVGFISSQKRWWLVTLMIAFGASFIAPRVRLLRRFLETLADRVAACSCTYIFR